jgi:hypothetical protein
MAKKTLIDVLRRAIGNAPTEDLPDWVKGLDVAVLVAEMDFALRRAGLAHGVEPTPRQ